jgi:hypothetical protein
MADPIKVKIGVHDKGFFDNGNNVEANKTALASGLNINDAINKAKSNSGSELIVVDSSGNASVHSLSVKDGFFGKENKTVDVKELTRGTNKNGYLKIDDNVANVFKAKSAFIVDKNNNVTYLGARVSTTTKEIELKDAEDYLNAPNKNKVDTAYVMGAEAGNTKRIETKLASNSLDQLSANYSNTKDADNAVSLLKPGTTKAVMESLLTNLKSIDSTKNTETAALTGELKARTAKYQSDLEAPTKRADKADAAWNTAHSQEENKVAVAYRNAREAKMPGVYNLENSVSNAEGSRNNAKSEMDSAISNRVSAQGTLAAVERVPGEAEALRNRNLQLKSHIDSLSINLVSYVGQTKSEISSAIYDKNRLINDTQRQVNNEYAKPVKPANSGTGSVTDDPFAKPSTGHTGSVTDDPFAKPGSGKTGSVTDDPFAKPGNKPGSVYDDPFANSNNYRNQGLIDTWNRQISDLKSDVSDLNSRANSLDNLAYKLRYTNDLSQLSSYGYNLTSTDRIVLNRYVSEYNSGVTEIQNNNSAIRDKDNYYRNNINPARNAVANASSNEEVARSNYATAENKLAQLAGQLDNLKSNPLPDTNPKVKPFMDTYNKAVANREATVGENAPLTKEVNASHAVVNSINSSYNQDKHALEGKINNSSSSAADQAAKMIQAARAKI